jgi:uncharacterized protein
VIALLDVNVLVALFDPQHVQHEAAHAWFGAHREKGWASCPLTENGLVRVLSQPAYPGRRITPADAVEGLIAFRNSGRHTFWPDTVSVCDGSTFRFQHIAGHRQLTDVYLLALAVEHRGRLATFDRGIRPESVAGAGREHLVVMGG